MSLVKVCLLLLAGLLVIAQAEPVPDPLLSAVAEGYLDARYGRRYNRYDNPGYYPQPVYQQQASPIVVQQTQNTNAIQ